MEPHTALRALTHPYDRLVPVTRGRSQLKEVASQAGSALIWQVSVSGAAETAAFVEGRPGGLSLIVILPEAPALEEHPVLLDAVYRARPRGLLPHHYGPRASDLAEVLRCPPLDLAADVTDYLTWRGISIDRETTQIVRQIIDLSAKHSTISGLARAMYMSRRALGRRLSTRGLPVPSHWLQFARLMRFATRLQNSEASIFSLAYELGYPDGFAVSNQMYRLIGHRPSEVRERLGWEWILEAWLRREAEGGGLAPGARRRVLDRSPTPPPSTVEKAERRRVRPKHAAG